jgi:hypothetical protein
MSDTHALTQVHAKISSFLSDYGIIVKCALIAPRSTVFLSDATLAYQTNITQKFKPSLRYQNKTTSVNSC